MKVGIATPKIIRRLPSHLKLASASSSSSSWHAAKKPLLVSGRESSNGTRSCCKVPKGCLAVYVGPELRRFVIPISFLAMPDLRILMDEYGCDHNGAIQIPCDEDYFHQILTSCSQRKHATNI